MSDVVTCAASVSFSERAGHIGGSFAVCGGLYLYCFTLALVRELEFQCLSSTCVAGFELMHTILRVDSISVG